MADNRNSRTAEAEVPGIPSQAAARAAEIASAEKVQQVQDRSEKERPSGSQPAGETQPSIRRTSFPNAGDLLAMLGIFLLAQVIGGFVALAVGGVPLSRIGDMTPDEMGKMLAISAVVAYVLTFFGILGYRRARGGRGRVARFSAKGLNPVLLLWGLLFVLAVGVVLEPLLGLLPPPSMQSYGTGFWTILAVVIFAPVFEELICRGLVLESLRSRYSVVVAWFLSALFFGVIHLQPQLVVNAFFMGLIFAYIYLRTDSLWSTMILHAINNGVAYIIMMMGYESFLLSDMIGNRTVYIAVYAVSAAVSLASGVMVWRSLRDLEHRKKESAM